MLAFTAQQLHIETEARLEQLQIALQLRQLEPAQDLRTSNSLLLATLLSARRLLAHYRQQLGPDARHAGDYLYRLESQVDALYLALSRL